MSDFFAEEARREAVIEEHLRRWVESEEARAEPPPAPTQPLSVRDGDLLLIGTQGAIDEKGYAELADRFHLPLSSDEYDPEDARLYRDLRREGWPVS